MVQECGWLGVAQYFPMLCYQKSTSNLQRKDFVIVVQPLTTEVRCRGEEEEGSWIIDTARGSQLCYSVQMFVHRVERRAARSIITSNCPRNDDH